MTPDQIKAEIDKAREVAGKATPGPWEWSYHGKTKSGLDYFLLGGRRKKANPKVTSIPCVLDGAVDAQDDGGVLASDEDREHIAHMNPARTQAWADCMEMMWDVLECVYQYDECSSCPAHIYDVKKKVRERLRGLG